MSAGSISPSPWALVAVHWIDAFDSPNGWINLKDYQPKTQHVVSVGWLWPDLLPGYISVTCSYCPEEEPDAETVGMVTHIPTGMVQKVINLGTPDFNSATPNP